MTSPKTATTMKKENWKQIIQIIITILTAIATTITTASCMNPCLKAAPYQGAPNVQSCIVG